MGRFKAWKFKAKPDNTVKMLINDASAEVVMDF